MSLDAGTRAWLEQTLGAALVDATLLQSLWGGYGAIWRCTLADTRRVVLKAVTPPMAGGLSHQRKLRSYAVETHWYAHWAPRCGPEARVPTALALDPTPGAWRLVLEDLQASGFSAPPQRALRAPLDWLAHFHATFLGCAPTGLWPMGSYWHLQTRPQEWARMASGPLQDAAQALDERLNAARFQTLIHGDAKVPNFCWGPRSVAAVDFQYVGGGCGVKDVAYLIQRSADPGNPAHLDRYFRVLRGALSGRPKAELDALEAEWRGLYPVAWADYCRFVAGWAPQRRQDALDRRMIETALGSI